MNDSLSFLADHLGQVLVLVFVLAATLFGWSASSLRRRFRAPRSERGPFWRALVSFALLVAGAAATALASFGLIDIGPSLYAQAQLVGEVAPPLEFRRVADDAPGRLADHRGKVVLVNVWATWCPPCRAEMLDLDQLQRDLGGRGLVVLTVSDEERSTLQSYLAESPMVTEHVYVEHAPWHAFGRPTSYLIDRIGTVRRIVQGSREYGSFVHLVEPFL